MLATVEVVPDGICLDSEGAVWVTDPIHSRLLRVAEGGEILEDVKLDGASPFACALGGEDGRTLFVCTARTFNEAECSVTRDAGVLMTRVEVAGA